MKLATEVISLMAAHPGRAFKMSEIIRYIRPGELTTKQRVAIQVSIWRILRELKDAKVVSIRRKNNARNSMVYRWKVTKAIHQVKQIIT